MILKKHFWEFLGFEELNFCGSTRASLIETLSLLRQGFCPKISVFSVPKSKQFYTKLPGKYDGTSFVPQGPRKTYQANGNYTIKI